MRTDRHSCASLSIESERLGDKAHGHGCDERNNLMLSDSERLSCRPRVFVRNRATGLVRATSALASLAARRIRENARCRR
ncbi:MAG: hypothetical protein QOJ45_1132 [Verrucomicrobiota bacterium]